jgi:hypothetical protein
MFRVWGKHNGMGWWDGRSTDHGDGSEDKLMGVRLMEDMARDYKCGVRTLVEEKRYDAVAVQSRGTM